MLTALAAVTSGSAPVIYGYDVVAYHSLPADASGVKGSPQFAYNLTSTDMSPVSPGVERMKDTAYEFHFSSAANLAKFQADPWHYTPAWGGF